MCQHVTDRENNFHIPLKKWHVPAEVIVTCAVPGRQRWQPPVRNPCPRCDGAFQEQLCSLAALQPEAR